jgi:antitoxin HigA-1
MKNPAHPGKLIRGKLEGLGVSVSAAARGLGVTRQQLQNVLAGRCAVSAEMALRLEKAEIGSSASALLVMQMRHDLDRLRKRGGSLKVKELTQLGKGRSA